MGVLPSCVSVYLVPTEVRKVDQLPGTGVADGCEPSCGFWELNLGPLGEQQVTVEPSLQPQVLLSFNVTVWRTSF